MIFRTCQDWILISLQQESFLRSTSFSKGKNQISSEAIKLDWFCTSLSTLIRTESHLRRRWSLAWVLLGFVVVQLHRALDHQPRVDDLLQHLGQNSATNVTLQERDAA